MPQLTPGATRTCLAVQQLHFLARKGFQLLLEIILHRASDHVSASPASKHHPQKHPRPCTDSSPQALKEAGEFKP